MGVSSFNLRVNFSDNLPNGPYADFVARGREHAAYLTSNHTMNDAINVLRIAMDENIKAQQAGMPGLINVSIRYDLDAPKWKGAYMSAEQMAAPFHSYGFANGDTVLINMKEVTTMSNACCTIS